MREIQAQQITDVVERLCIEANEQLPEDIKNAIHRCRACEDWEIAQGVLDQIITNFEIAGEERVPICQDTGMACVFLEIGQDVHITGGDLREAVDEGVRRGYDKGYLRKSVVRDPVRRGNTGDNTPAMLYGNCAGRADKGDGRPQGLRKRKYERYPDVQALRRDRGHQGFYPGDGGKRGTQSMSAYGSGCGNRRHLR